MPTNRVKDLEKSLTAGSVLITGDDRVARYVPPDADGYVFTLEDGLPKWKAAMNPSVYEEYADFASFPETGEAGKVYLDIDESKFYIWNGSTYIEVPFAGDFSFTAAGDSGPSQIISNADTLTVKASKGFTAVASATGNITVTPPSGTDDDDVMLWDSGLEEWVPGALPVAATDTNKQNNIQWKDEGSNLGSSGDVTTVNVVGAGATATIVGHVLTLTIPANAGETNTASNVNAGGVGVFKQKSGVDLQFRGVNSADASVNVVLDAAHNEIDLNVVHSSASGNVTFTDGNGIAAIPVIEYFTPADGSRTLTLAVTPRTGTVIKVKRNGLPDQDWTIVANVITMDTDFDPSIGGEAGAQTASVDYWK